MIFFLLFFLFYTSFVIERASILLLSFYFSFIHFLQSINFFYHFYHFFIVYIFSSNKNSLSFLFFLFYGVYLLFPLRQSFHHSSQSPGLVGYIEKQLFDLCCDRPEEKQTQPKRTTVICFRIIFMEVSFKKDTSLNQLYNQVFFQLFMLLELN